MCKVSLMVTMGPIFDRRCLFSHVQVRLLAVALFHLVSKCMKSPCEKVKSYSITDTKDLRAAVAIRHARVTYSMSDLAAGAQAVSAASPCTASAMTLAHTVEDPSLRGPLAHSLASKYGSIRACAI